MRRGYDRVGVLHGGFDEWMRRDLPTQPKAEEVRLLPGTRASRCRGAQNPSA